MQHIWIYIWSLRHSSVEIVRLEYTHLHQQFNDLNKDQHVFHSIYNILMWHSYTQMEKMFILRPKWKTPLYFSVCRICYNKKYNYNFCSEIVVNFSIWKAYEEVIIIIEQVEFIVLGGLHKMLPSSNASFEECPMSPCDHGIMKNIKRRKKEFLEGSVTRLEIYEVLWMFRCFYRRHQSFGVWASRKY